MNGLLQIPAALLLLAGAALLLVAAWGVVRLPDALARQHAATKAGTLALACVCLGAAGWMQDAVWTLRLLVILVFLLVTLPVASHLLARAAVREGHTQADIDAAPRVDNLPGRG